MKWYQYPIGETGVMASIFVLIILLGTMAWLGTEHDQTIALEAMKAGLQQCPTDRGLAWQKECVK